MFFFSGKIRSEVIDQRSARLRDKLTTTRSWLTQGEANKIRFKLACFPSGDDRWACTDRSGQGWGLGYGADVFDPLPLHSSLGVVHCMIVQQQRFLSRLRRALGDKREKKRDGGPSVGGGVLVEVCRSSSDISENMGCYKLRRILLLCFSRLSGARVGGPVTTK